ncbi:MAG: ABC transporter permease subunit, partial [Acidimicrobiaceae bacterium]|nr:ABC transporter permease subunit [Acidimicrobiaceae bacterium]
MRVLAQQQSDEALRPGFFDNQVTEQFLIPVGAWADQAVDWIAVRLDWLLAIVEWPFENLINLVVEDILEPLPWVVVAIAFFVIGTLTRNVRVGAFAAGALSLCGILGNNYWLETARTIGFVGVAVLLCVIVGIPLGVACGRTDSTWRVVRPLLDGMQVIPSFVYMLPFIFFFGVGVVPATMVTMTFALPPLVRLTNLGIRQVPGDVVEASRAYGAPEWRVLLDVQLPLARPAIATGINQTLLLAVSMLGIAAIMGAGGLGRVLFQAITTQDIPKGMASGLAFFLVAVVLDRISQPEDTDSAGLIRRVRLAWAHRRDPERLLTTGEGAGADASEGRFARVTAKERLPMGIAAAGGVLAVVSVFLTWTSGAGLFSAYGRRADEDLAQQSFSGLEASGGSWFGYMALGLGLLVVGAALMTLLGPGRGPRWLTADGSLISSLALLVMMACYVLASAADAAASYSAGAGVYVALAGALLASAGSFWWVSLAPHSPLHPLTARIGWGRVVLAGVAVVILGMAAISGWSFDQRK